MDEVAQGWRWWPASDELDVEVALTHQLQRTQPRRIDPGIEMQIAMLTGHSVRDVRSILNARYLSRDPAMALDAIRKLKTIAKTSSRLLTGIGSSQRRMEKAWC